MLRVPPTDDPSEAVAELASLSGTARRLLVGAVDTHVHSGPDVVARKADDHWLARSAADVGMAAFVLKSNHCPTPQRAYLAERLVSGLRVIGGLVLNHSLGGLNPAAVEAALRAGARIIWMSTTSTRGEKVKAGTPKHVTGLNTPTRRITLRDPRTHRRLDAILELVRDADAVLSTGHLYGPDLDLLVERAQRVGVRRLLVTHAETLENDMPVEKQIALAARNVYFERCYLSALVRNRLTPDQLVAQIRAVGLGRTVLGSDLGMTGQPLPAVGLGRYLVALHEAGLTEDELRVVAGENARALFSI